VVGFGFPDLRPSAQIWRLSLRSIFPQQFVKEPYFRRLSGLVFPNLCQSAAKSGSSRANPRLSALIRGSF
jgi:hypothetical protein